MRLFFIIRALHINVNQVCYENFSKIKGLQILILSIIYDIMELTNAGRKKE